MNYSMRHTFAITVLTLLCGVLTLGSCRDSADEVYDFSSNNGFSFAKANTLAGQFDAFWMAMNANYCLWDVEQEKYGYDWDAVYDKYLPYFKVLDEQYKKDSVDIADSLIFSAYKDIISPLHDGHLSIEITNIRNKARNTKTYDPEMMRLQSERPDQYKEARAYQPNLTHYTKEGRISREKTSGISSYGTGYVNQVLVAALSAANDSLLKAAPSQAERYRLAIDDIQKCIQHIKEKKSSSVVMSEYEALHNKYSYLGLDIPLIGNSTSNGGIAIMSTVFDDCIPYLYISNFNLTTYLDKSNRSKFTNKSYYDFYQPLVTKVWQAWFDNIQRLYAAGQLKGVIIDVRCNSGGYCSDFKYVMGTLAPVDMHIGYNHRKSGTARLDYTPLSQTVAAKYPEEHAAILGDSRFKVVVLANAMSVSMAEITSLSTKSYDNAFLVGTRTFGGLGALHGDDDYDYSYSGSVGKSGETPFYCYIPYSESLTLGKESLEGIGVTPDYEVPLDLELFRTSYNDTQLNKAIEVIK